MRCLICDSEAVIELLNFGMQPLCNRFPESPNGKEYLHQMILGQCSTCGLIQISKPVPSSELSPRYDWITYNEPEGHLDSLAEIVSKLSGLTQGATILGVSYKDDSTLRRLEERNFTNIRRLDPAEDLGIFGKKPEIETIQDRLTPEAANKIVRRLTLSLPDTSSNMHTIYAGLWRRLSNFLNPRDISFLSPQTVHSPLKNSTTACHGRSISFILL